MMKTILILLIALFIGCDSKLPIKGEFPDLALIDQNKNQFSFNNLKGKVFLVNYIYTNCPDVCQIASKRINIFKKKLDEKGLGNEIYFISISFDPKRDTPEVLKQYITKMNLNLSNWVFVTGSENNIRTTINTVGLDPIKETEYRSDNHKHSHEYTINHRDRISLVDERGRIRKHYKSSNFDMDELLKDINSLL